MHKSDVREQSGAVSSASQSARPMTLTAKILLHHAVGARQSSVGAGDLLRVSVDWTLASELAWNGMDRTHEALGRPAPYDRERFYLAIDHTVDEITLRSDPRVQRLVTLSRDFARQARLRHFYDANVTILHTTFYRDLLRPGDLVLGADSHTSSHGGLGAFAIGLGGADVTVAMVLGETWIEVPEAISVQYQGQLPFGLTGKDVILRTLGLLGRNTVALERSVEFGGEAARHFSADMRFTICNMTAEFGGLNGVFTPDALIADYVDRRGQAEYRGGLFFAADEGAPYLQTHAIALDRLAPQVARPFAPDNVCAVDEVADLAIDGAFIGACTTTEEELVLGALVLEQALETNPRIAPSSKRLVVPGNLDIADRLRDRGLLAIYDRAGFRVGAPGCSMCLGVGSDKAGEGETWLSSQNRNFRNRMGKGSIAYLASAATVAASAVGMRVTDPRALLARVDAQRYASLLGRARSLPEIRRHEPQPSASTDGLGADPQAARNTAAAPRLAGRVQRFGDHVDTDAIIPGEFCHLTEHADLGAHCFEHVRPEFRERARSGQTIVVAQEGWGSGSSREQAVWALKGAGIRAVIARSFAFIHKRNLVNEALPYLVLTDDAFYAAVEENAALEIDLGRGVVRIQGSEREYRAAPLSPMVQALAEEGGIVAAIRRHGPKTFATLQRG